MKKIFGLFMLLSLPMTGKAVSGNVEASDTSKVVDLDEVVVVSQSKETARLRLQPLSSSASTVFLPV
jgi:D-alanine-D-alanine ligase-like ATP-grasp enzyme